MEASVRTFFQRYERLFNDALRGDADMNDVAALYAPEFIASSPAGVMAGKNDDQFKEVMAQGYAGYRAIGTQAMHYFVRDLDGGPRVFGWVAGDEQALLKQHGII